MPRGAPLRAHKREALRQPENVAAGLSVPERLLLFCIASHTDWQKAGPGTTVTAMMVRGLIERNGGRRLSLDLAAICAPSKNSRLNRGICTGPPMIACAHEPRRRKVLTGP